MIYKQISSKVVIGRVFEEFNIDYSGFVPRVPNWIHSAMRKLNLFVSLLNVTAESAVADYKVAVPSDCKLLLGCSYLGKRLPRTDKINQYVTDDMDSLVHDEYSYQLDNNGYVITTFEECDADEFKFYYKKLPVELDTTTNLYFPLIPDDEELIEALSWYVVMRIMRRGHKVPGYSLKDNNVYTNPAMAWERHQKIAINSVTALDADERDEISNMMRTFLYDKNYYTSGSFNYQSITP